MTRRRAKEPEVQLQRLREARGWTREELGKHIDQNASESWARWIEDIETGSDNLFPPCTWCAIANALGVTVNVLFGNEGVS